MPSTKIVTVRYGALSSAPHKKNIEKTINKWMKKGYKLADRQEHKPGCATMVFTCFWARGNTELTFVKEE